MERSYIYFYGGEGRKYSVYISPEDGSCIKCPAPAERRSMVYVIAAVLVVLIALVIIFRDQIVALATSIWKNINGDAKDILN